MLSNTSNLWQEPVSLAFEFWKLTRFLCATQFFYGSRPIMTTRQASARNQAGTSGSRSQALASPTAGRAQAATNPPRFALAPALISDQFIDYSTVAGQKLFKAATEPLKVTFDCTPENLQLFIEGVKDKARIYGWMDSLFTIGDDDKDLLDQYGEIELSEIRAHVEGYYDRPTRTAQQSIQLYQCLMGSLTQDALNRVVLQSSKYMVDKIPSGALLFKIIVGIAHIDTAATINHLRQKLSALDALMSTVNSDVEKFNSSVQLWVKSLRARGHEHSGLITSLFEGYTSATDRQFVAYIKKKEDAFEEGQPIDADELMQMALNKYRILVDKGQWNAPTEEQQKIFVLQAEIQQLKKSKKNSSSNTSATTAAASSSKPSKDRKQKKEKPDWMTKKPSEGEPKQKKVGGKQYYWCPNHQAWTRHSPSECRGVGTNRPTESTNNTPSAQKALKLSSAFASVAAQEEDRK